ncbi:MAG: ion transporter, partial [Clostridia bacterium]|nr:ion transporter [Clostridia bacterium]
MSEEKKLPVEGETPEFDENCEFLEDIQKRETPEEPPVEEFVEMEKGESVPEEAEHKQSRLERLAERQNLRESKLETTEDTAEKTGELTAATLTEEAAEAETAPKSSRYSDLRKLVFQMVEVGYNETGITRGYDILSFVLIILNVVASVMFTFDYCELHYGTYLHWVEAVTVAFFAIDYVLRLWTAPLLHPQDRAPTAVRKYVISFWGI